MTPDFDADQLEAYDAAVARARELRAEWERLDKPYMATGSTGQMVAHPLVKMIQDAEGLAAKLRSGLAPKHRGPAASAVVSSIGKSPAAKLRRVR